MFTPSRIFLITGLCMSAATLWAQRQTPLPVSPIGTYTGSEKWIQFNPSSGISTVTLWSQYGKEMGLGSDDAMIAIKSETDNLGWTHHRFQQLYKGIPVEFALYTLHEQGGQAIKGNGEIAREVHVDVTSALSRDEAFALALNYIGADSYYWQIPLLEDMKRHATGDPSATFYPAGELLITDEDFLSRTKDPYHLAWKFEIYSYQPEGRRWIYINAKDGTVIKTMDLDMHDHGFEGTAETRYSGVRPIMSDSTELGFVLRDHTRGRGVETYDALNNNTVDGAVHFYDDDNYWTNRNDRADDAATDAHWATEMYYDYLLNRHGIYSYDNHGSKLISYVHVGEKWYNASWSGFWTRFGDAGGEPWTFVDVVGHEFTHGFTWAHAGLIYEGEPGALNESCSDIMGEALQRHAHGYADWLATPSPVDTIRNYMNPNVFENPDTYQGEFWEFGEADNYGVHTNSGVQNHWFYLLVEGGTGTNDNGDVFNVEPIGFENAIDIFMRNMTAYLFPTADYFDARQGSLQSAEDLFGACSYEYRQVANAWHAVGVGERVEEQDFTVLGVEEMDLCSVGSTAPVRMQVKHLGCVASGPVTLYMKLVKSNPVVIFTDTLHLPEGVGAGEVFDFVFSKEFDFSRKGEHILTGEVICENDLNKGNDISKSISIHNLAQVSEQEFRFHNRIALRTFRDSIAFKVGEFADLDILSNVGRDSTYGIRIEGNRLWYSKPVYRYDDPFDYNERLGSQICFCVDATGLDALGLQFDLRQTWSNAFQDMVSGDQQKSSVLRIMVDDTELARYFPETHSADAWKTHVLDLSEYLGSEFTLCFETRTLVSLEEDNTYDIGDRVYLDNIEFTSQEISTATKGVPDITQLVIYPNPAGDIMYIDVPAVQASSAEVVLLDLHGKVMHTQKLSLIPGVNKTQCTVTSIAAGVYVVEVRTEGERLMGKVVVNNE